MNQARIEVLAAGVQTAVQDLGGRRGLWGVGVPPSGAYDELSFALANLAVGNDPGAAGLEAVLVGPTLRFHVGAERGGHVLAALTGACANARLDGRRIRPGEPFAVVDGSVLEFGACGPSGLRGYLAVRGGFAVPRVLGSRATFLLGGFGGGVGRALEAGDELGVGRDENCAAPAELGPILPELTSSWTLRVIPGPHGAPDYFTGPALADLFAAGWEVDHRSDRTGVRLAGPAVEFARADGGEAGLHPCNIHDSAYPIGGIMVSGDTPVIVGPDGPSLGGFVVPAAVIQADLWKLGQLRPGDRVRLEPVTPQAAELAGIERRELLADPRAAVASVLFPAPLPPAPKQLIPVATWDRPEPLVALEDLSIRFSGDHHLLVEAGPARLDLTMRARVHLLHRELTARGLLGAAAGVPENVEGVRSLLLGFDPRRVDPRRLAERIGEAWLSTPDPAGVELPVREVTMPICFDDPDAHEAMRRYQRGVRPDAPWCPDNVEFIRRVNGLSSRDEVFEIVRKATYLVIGLGDVYLGAPVAVPLDPAHRLVTTKYDPPRTWTPENAVGIGGAYLCVYGMEGPGGYQLVGRTVPVWRKPPPDTEGAPSTADPWLLRTFDLLRFEPVGHDELMELRAGIADGSQGLSLRPTTLDLGTLPGPESPLPPETAEFTRNRERAFAAERARWAEAAALKTGA
ncbi:MAG TPA: 5-oxoprolinase/urea amidolyase family protein [Actinospica sp.]|nr:5-oxoprolinase/urea amidolyase family protein [Actinospica sp.]